MRLLGAHKDLHKRPIELLLEKASNLSLGGSHWFCKWEGPQIVVFIIGLHIMAYQRNERL